MKTHRKHLFLLSMLVVGLGMNLTLQTAYAINTYTVTGLTASISRGSAINDSGVVAGLFGSLNDWPLSSTIVVLRWQATTGVQNLGTAGYSGWATTVNRSGVIAGMGATQTYGVVSAFRCPLSSVYLELLPKLPGGGDADTSSINTGGVIVGFGNSLSCCCGDWPCTANPGHATYWSGSTIQRIPDLGGYCSDATGINDFGVVCGSAAISTNTQLQIFHAFRNPSTNGIAQDLGTLGGSSSYANAINNAGLIVGYSQMPGNNSQHAVLWNGGSIQDLGTLPGGINSTATFIGPGCDILGYSDNKVVIWPSGAAGPIDLNKLIPTNSGWVIVSANGMNASGTIVGSGRYNNGAEVAIILTVTPTNVVHIDPVASFYFRSAGDAANTAVPIKLSDVGVEPGEYIQIRQLGVYNYWYNHDPALVASNIYGVFSSSSTILDASHLHRLPGAIGLLPSDVSLNPGITPVATQNTYLGASTDIPEDFIIFGTSILRVPTNAAYLFVGTDDIYNADNVDVNNDFAIEITPLNTSLTISLSGSNIVIAWPTNPAGFNLQSAPAVTGAFTNIPGATNPYTNPITGGQQFFRLIYP